jgi:hypothetical protein
MGLYAFTAGFVFHRVGEHAPAIGRGLRIVAALGSTCVGVLWMRAAMG